MVASPENFPLLKELLADQQRLATPVARFSDAHAAATLPALEPVYRDLIPLTSPRAGEQYAFEVALDSCTGCKACVSACHSLNGLDDEETWRDVGLIVGGEECHPVQQTVTTACHHCADPACLNGCPVLAYEKDPGTGIVRHLDDQCIGCQYCVLKCPYDVPKYNARLGIVRKCDLCHSRLAEGEAPACVQACPTHAIRIITVPLTSAAPASFTHTTQAIGKGNQVDTTSFLPAAPDPAYTQPTTRYVSERAMPSMHAADAHALRPQAPHWPLVIMLTLMPLAVGSHGAAAFLLGSGEPMDAPGNVKGLLLAGWLAGAVGLASSVAHLGQPLRAWRIFLGWRKSWLSREAMLFGAWFACATVATAFHFAPLATPLAGILGVDGASFVFMKRALVGASALVGAVALFCSVMIYVDTRRQFWRLAQTGPRFFGTTIILGAVLCLALDIAPVGAALVLAAATLLKLAVEIQAVRPASENETDALPCATLNTARILAGPLRKVWGSRVTAAGLFSLLLPAMDLGGQLPFEGGWLIFAGVLGGELAERYLFFRAVDAPKMPGMPGVTARVRHG